MSAQCFCGTATGKVGNKPSALMQPEPYTDRSKPQHPETVVILTVFLDQDGSHPLFSPHQLPQWKRNSRISFFGAKEEL